MVSLKFEVVGVGVKKSEFTSCKKESNWSLSLKNGVLYIRQKEDVVTFSGDKLSNGEKVTAVGTQVRFDETNTIVN